MSRKKRPQHNEETVGLDKSHIKDSLSALFGKEIDGLNFNIRCKFEFNDTHKSFLQLLNYEQTKMVLVDGPAGSSKTYLSVLAGLTALSQHKVEKIVYIRSIVESASKSIGALPGELDEKFKPWSIPLMEKLDELVTKTTINNLMTDGRIECIPVNFVRGMTFSNSFVIVDEIQNLTYAESVSVLTRFGHNSKYAIIGDSKQADIGHHSGFSKILKCFDDKECEDNGIHTFQFTENDIVRSKILKLITRKLGAN